MADIKTLYFFIFVIKLLKGLEVCEDHYTDCPPGNCGQYPLDPLYRLHCMKTCGVCTDVNRALSKPTAQSSTGDNRASSKAVDGNSNLHSLTCSKTNNTDQSAQWWCVDLQQIYNIDTITIHTHNTHGERLNGFNVKLGLSGKCDDFHFGFATTCYTDSSTTSSSPYTIVGCNNDSPIPLVGRFVYISNQSPTTPLALCEVGIFTGTKCNAGYYSYNATSCLPCDTCVQNSCYDDSGVCWDGCTVGYRGETCRQCEDGLFGQSCRFTCNTTRCTDNCDRKTGKCHTCDVGYYGDNCQFPCSGDCEDGRCVQSDGSCVAKKKVEIVQPIIPTQSDPPVDRTLVGIIGAIVGIVLTAAGFILYSYIRKRKKSYHLAKDKRPPSKYNLEMSSMAQSYLATNRSSEYSHTERPESMATSSQYLPRRDLSNSSSAYTAFRPPAELPENEKRRIKEIEKRRIEDRMRASINDDDPSYQYNDFDTTHSVYESVKAQV